MNITAQKIIDEATRWIGYREKNHASADLEDFYADAGDGNYTIFSSLCGYGIVPWQWCQLFVCSIFVIVCGGIDNAKKILFDTDDNGTMTSYTPTGSQYFKSAGRWHTGNGGECKPEVGDVVYFYGYVSSEGRSRICHTGIVSSVDTVHKTFKTIEGNSNHDGFTTNGGCVTGNHEYSYANVGGGNRVNGFGRPDYNGNADGVYIRIGG